MHVYDKVVWGFWYQEINLIGNIMFTNLVN